MESMQTDLAPIVLFVYNRLWHTKQTIEALKKNELANNSELFIFSDQAKSPIDVPKVNEVREYIKTISGFKNVLITERAENFGLAKSIIDGVTTIVNTYGKIIVLEDDLITSPFFLKYMNDALSLYHDEEKVASIHGYIYPIEGLPDYFFIRGADCWGWATWKRAWDFFEPDGKRLLKELKTRKLIKEADFNSTYNFTKMLKDQIRGKNNSWAVRWYISAFLHDMLTLYPSHSYVHNIGHDNSGTHCANSNNFDVIPSGKLTKLNKVVINENREAKRKMEDFFRTTKPIFYKRFLLKIKKLPLKPLIKQLLPPFLVILIKKIKGNQYGWFGDYKSWEEAKSQTTGYNETKIINKVKESLLKVKNGTAIYERDGVIFDEIQYSWPVLSGLLLAAGTSKGEINVLDFGGSLGSTYFQNKKFLNFMPKLSWNIVEQEEFVRIGKSEFANNILSFYSEINECIKEKNPNVLLLSSVLQYLEKPYNTLNQLLEHRFDFIIMDRTMFTNGGRDVIKIQNVPPSIYEASYPCWMLSENKFIEYISHKGYFKLEEFCSSFENSELGIPFKGFILKNAGK